MSSEAGKKLSLLVGAVLLFPIGMQDKAAAAPKLPIIIEDFESYKTTLDLASPWYKPPHGNKVEQSIDKKNVGGGKQAMRLDYTIEEKPGLHYVGICNVHKWNLTGANAIKLWFKPDGSGRHLGIQLNIADDRGVNIHDLWDVKYEPEKGDTKPRWITIPFKDFKQDTRFASAPVAKAIKPEAVCEIAFYVSSKKGYFGKGSVTIDEIQGVFVK